MAAVILEVDRPAMIYTSSNEAMCLFIASNINLIMQGKAILISELIRKEHMATRALHPPNIGNGDVVDWVRHRAVDHEVRGSSQDSSQVE